MNVREFTRRVRIEARRRIPPSHTRPAWLQRLHARAWREWERELAREYFKTPNPHDGTPTSLHNASLPSSENASPSLAELAESVKISLTHPKVALPEWLMEWGKPR